MTTKEVKITCPHCGGIMKVRNIDEKTAAEFNKLFVMGNKFSKLMAEFGKRVEEIFKNA